MHISVCVHCVDTCMHCMNMCARLYLCAWVHVCLWVPCVRARAPVGAVRVCGYMVQCACACVHAYGCSVSVCAHTGAVCACVHVHVLQPRTGPVVCGADPASLLGAACACIFYAAPGCSVSAFNTRALPCYSYVTSICNGLAPVSVPFPRALGGSLSSSLLGGCCHV